jgi:catechol 2,3-dioxygenase-like lactoylglutathione lyase family enzyme/ribosomal protein S18 acetylase RimI-like enzyme
MTTPAGDEFELAVGPFRNELFVLRDQAAGSGPTCRRILDTLPTWFGIPEAVEDYVAVADRKPSVIASIAGVDVGIVTVIRHSPSAAEVHLMAVLPEHHRRGIGRAMLRHVEAGLARDRVEFLQVKTLSDRDPDEGYAKTRAFYRAYGFRPLEEFPELWDPQNPALQMIKSIGLANVELVTIVVDDYDRAIEFFVDTLGFDLVEDSPSETNDGRPKRWVVVRPPGAQTGILVARADGADQRAIVGGQVAGRVGFFLRVDDFDESYDRLVSAGVRFVSSPRDEPYGRVAVFVDVAGNRWDLLGARPD